MCVYQDSIKLPVALAQDPITILASIAMLFLIIRTKVGDSSSGLARNHRIPLLCYGICVLAKI